MVVIRLLNPGTAALYLAYQDPALLFYLCSSKSRRRPCQTQVALPSFS
jgi:hypothetical protein